MASNQQLVTLLKKSADILPASKDSHHFTAAVTRGDLVAALHILLNEHKQERSYAMKLEEADRKNHALFTKLQQQLRDTRLELQDEESLVASCQQDSENFRRAWEDAQEELSIVKAQLKALKQDAAGHKETIRFFQGVREAELKGLQQLHKEKEELRQEKADLHAQIWGLEGSLRNREAELEVLRKKHAHPLGGMLMGMLGDE